MAQDATHDTRPRKRGPLGFFRNLKTARKLLAGFLVLTGLMAAIGGLGLVKLSAAEHALVSMYENRLVAVDTLGRVEARFEALRFRLVDYTIATEPEKKQAIRERIAELWDPLESTCRHASLSIL